MSRRAEMHQEFRRRAEQKLAGRPKNAEPLKDPAALVHELEVHQIELELQNEELCEARTAAEDALRLYKELFDFAPIGYAVLDAQGAIRKVNLQAARMFGLGRRELGGQRFASLLEPVRRSDFATFLARVLAGDAEDGERQAFEVTLETASPGPIEACLVATALAGAQPPQALVSIQDITSQRRAEESERKDQFLAALSHELRNPLAPIRSGLAVLQRPDVREEQRASTLALVVRQVDQLVHLVDDLLDVTRIAHGKIRLVPERLDLGGLVRAALDDHRATFESRGVALEGSIPAQVLCVSADRTRLVQVLGNVLDNALKFTPRGGHVGVALRRDDGVAVLSVRDTGVGISPEVRSRLFEPFVQAPQSLDRTHGGLGLGLAMVKGLVEIQGGAVDVASAGIGMGTEVTIRLPLVEAAPSRPSPPEARPKPAPKRVLVIDDCQDAADTLRDLLAMNGHDVRVAYDGPTGIRAAHGFRPEVVLCDIGLPDMDGYAVAQTIRGDDELRGSYLVALTGYAGPQDRERSAAAGFDRHLAKPPSLDALEDVIASAPALPDPPA